MIHTSNWIEKFNKLFRRTLSMRHALPNPKPTITLLGFLAIVMGEKTNSYPISNFKFDHDTNQNIIKS